MRGNRAGAIIMDAYALEVIGPFQADDFCAGSENDRRILFNPTNQISRHAIGQPLRSDEHVDATRTLREKYGRLTRRITSACDDDLFSTTQLRFDECRAV